MNQLSIKLAKEKKILIIFYSTNLTHGSNPSQTNFKTKFDERKRKFHCLNVKLSKKNTTHLNPSFREASSLGQFFSSVDIRILGPLKRGLQLLQLFSGERGPASALLSLQRNAWFTLRVGLVATPTCRSSNHSVIVFTLRYTDSFRVAMRFYG